MLKKRLPSNYMTGVFILLALLLVVFIGLPIIRMVFGAQPATLLDSILDPVVIKSLWLTVYSSLIATAIGIILGIPLAYLLARRNFAGKSILEGLINLPVVIPHSAAGIALLFVFGRNFIIGKFFNGMGISFVDSVPGIIVAMLFVSVPFMIDTAKEGFKRVDERLEKVARTLGASPWQTFYKISLPLSRRSIVAGALLMWGRGLSEFGAVVILAYHPMIAPILIYERFQTQGLEYAVPVAVLLVLISLIIFIGFRWFVQREKKT
ncbi:MAG: ABC transporter permease [Dehalococcoidales bacterium]|nr:ABC transporter permease [Dehalococcoidales bacterium]